MAARVLSLLFIIGFRRYKKDQTWKRNEFVAKEIMNFTSDKVARNAMYMLDWGERYIELFADKLLYDERFEKVNRKILKSALQFHGLRKKEDGKMRFTPTEVAIRDTFDHFFSYFERFDQFIEAGLITETELNPYLQYWIKSLTTEVEDDTRNFIYHYINEYNFAGTQNLFNKFGHDICPNTDIKSTEIDADIYAL